MALPADVIDPKQTPEGWPDLQGTWTNATLIPLERRKELGAKEFYTEQEKAEMDAKPKKPVGSAVVAHYDLSQFGLDRTQSKFAPNLRTSLIIGPEGRLPAFTPAAAKCRAVSAIMSPAPIMSAVWALRSE